MENLCFFLNSLFNFFLSFNGSFRYNTELISAAAFSSVKCASKIRCNALNFVNKLDSLSSSTCPRTDIYKFKRIHIYHRQKAFSDLLKLKNVFIMNVPSPVCCLTCQCINCLHSAGLRIETKKMCIIRYIESSSIGYITERILKNSCQKWNYCYHI